MYRQIKSRLREIWLPTLTPWQRYWKCFFFFFFYSVSIHLCIWTTKSGWIVLWLWKECGTIWSQRVQSLLCHQCLWNVASARGCGFLTTAAAAGQQLGGAVPAAWNGSASDSLLSQWLFMPYNAEPSAALIRRPFDLRRGSNVCDGYQQLRLPLVLRLTERQLGERWSENARRVGGEGWGGEESVNTGFKLWHMRCHCQLDMRY